MTQRTQHPLSAAFPPMGSLEFTELVNDIRVNGLHSPIVIFEGEVLDGWHRYRACDQLGLNAATVDFPEGQDPVAFVRSQNYHRRHLSASQKAVAEVELRKWAQSGENQHTRGGAPGAPPPGTVTVEAMAEFADVGERTIQQAKRVVEAGLADVVKSGEVSVKRAAEVAKLPEPERRAALQAPPTPRPKPEPKTPAGGTDAQVAFIQQLQDANRALQNQVRILEAESEMKAQALENLRDDMTETARLLRDTQEENESLLRVVEADDQVKAAMAEAKRFRELARVVEERNRGLQGQNHALAGDAKRWMNRVRRLEKKLGIEPTTPEEEPPPGPGHEEIPAGLFPDDAA